MFVVISNVNTLVVGDTVSIMSYWLFCTTLNAHEVNTASELND